MADVDVREGSTPILTGITWQVRCNEHWVIAGPNGAGKSALLKVAAGWRVPSKGTVDILGRRVGETDLRALRRRVGYLSSSLQSSLRPSLLVSDVVVCGRTGALEPWWNQYSAADRQQAVELLDYVGCADHRSKQLATLSDGERTRVMIARLLMSDPSILVLDEPTAGLDLDGREHLLHLLWELAKDREHALILATHQLEDVPSHCSQALLLRKGEIFAMGPIDDVFRSAIFSELFNLDLCVDRASGRWSARTQRT